MADKKRGFLEALAAGFEPKAKRAGASERQIKRSSKRGVSFLGSKDPEVQRRVMKLREAERKKKEKEKKERG